MFSTLQYRMVQNWFHLLMTSRKAHWLILRIIRKNYENPLANFLLPNKIIFAWTFPNIPHTPQQLWNFPRFSWKLHQRLILINSERELQKQQFFTLFFNSTPNSIWFWREEKTWRRICNRGTWLCRNCVTMAKDSMWESKKIEPLQTFSILWREICTAPAIFLLIIYIAVLPQTASPFSY